jgi:hypothetical protein
MTKKHEKHHEAEAAEPASQKMSAAHEQQLQALGIDLEQAHGIKAKCDAGAYAFNWAALMAFVMKYASLAPTFIADLLALLAGNPPAP